MIVVRDKSRIGVFIKSPFDYGCGNIILSKTGFRIIFPFILRIVLFKWKVEMFAPLIEVEGG